MNNHKPQITKERLLALLGALPADKLFDLVRRANAARAGRAESRSADRFAELEIGLPTHQASMNEAKALMNRLRAQKPNLTPKAS